MDHERRQSPRYPFHAEAEVTEEESKAKLTAKVSELSVNGCYVDMVNPLPQGTAVMVKIFTETEFVEARAVVVYSHPNMGMGIAFRQLGKTYYLETLRKWFLSAIAAKKEMEG